MSTEVSSAPVQIPASQIGDENARTAREKQFGHPSANVSGRACYQNASANNSVQLRPSTQSRTN